MKKLKNYVFISVFTGIVALLFTLSHCNKKPEVEKVPVSITPEKYKNGMDIFITPGELKNRLGSKNLVILDASHPKSYAREHIPGAIGIGFKGLCRTKGKPGKELWGTILPKEKLTKKLESLGITNNSLIVAYSDILRGPGAGGRAVWQLRMSGLKKVKLLYGGLEVWKRLGYELTSDRPVIKPSTGLVLKKYNENYRADRHFVKNNLGKIKIVDVRSVKEFTGKDTSRGESREGHIKGAQWLEWKTILREDSSPKSPEKIVTLMSNLGIKPGDDFVVY